MKMDKECEKICNALNKLPSVKTIESCCGHGKDDFYVWFYVSDIRVVNVLGRLMSHNYAPYCWYSDSNGKWHENWKISIATDDVMNYDSEMLFCLVGNKDNPNLFNEADKMADCLLNLWEDFCKYTLKIKPAYKSDDEYFKIISEYKGNI